MRIGSANAPTLHQTLTNTKDASLLPTLVRDSIHHYLLDDEQEHRTRTSGLRVQANTSAPIHGPQDPQGYGTGPQIPRRYLQLLLPFVSYIVSGTWVLLSCLFSSDNAIQSIILESPWFKSGRRLCAYISCSALREVDTSKLLSETLSNPTGVMLANEPVDLFLLPGLGFDRSGRRLGRGGGYYNTFLKKYQELAKARDWKQPLLVVLSYSVQIMDEGVIAVTPDDIPVDALVSPIGVIPISQAALDR
ncbi:5-formyltetrahydrofolate cyclo-ligase, mitochondrial-like isoform X2 [Juglans microcarpa x Juglans regia]|uniref:5-formyltetrahydrofolate cyclo-ligase, mitochondrial-like isoform X2 n=1 Tax=Juglans microcarpa x Juglans regia TaxID=2249226 RepID=UPI001B7DFAAE|nr:5-formyltetrahydrofolate cyclo-ligase, mitochondrial-like isoform X2 [Juglans microcarpa x Juglans regia]